MSPSLVSILLNLLGVAIQEEPTIADSIKSILAKKDPTVDDWKAEAQSWADDSYGKEVPDSKLPPDSLS